tara:strand:+ start:27 stop:164 length:138 start_codon:yes stop_codon:yes gene_type:complete
VCISALEEAGWVTNDDGLWYDPEKKKKKKKKDCPTIGKLSIEGDK